MFCWLGLCEELLVNSRPLRLIMNVVGTLVLIVLAESSLEFLRHRLPAGDAKLACCDIRCMHSRYTPVAYRGFIMPAIDRTVPTTTVEYIFAAGQPSAFGPDVNAQSIHEKTPSATVCSEPANLFELCFAIDWRPIFIKPGELDQTSLNFFQRNAGVPAALCVDFNPRSRSVQQLFGSQARNNDEAKPRVDPGPGTFSCYSSQTVSVHFFASYLCFFKSHVRYVE